MQLVLAYVLLIGLVKENFLRTSKSGVAQCVRKWNYCRKWLIILEPTALDLTLNFQSMVVQIQLEIEHALLFSGTLMFPHDTPTCYYSYHDQKSGFSY